jgi:phosphatidylserine/phosphatidylglycerophosphate/cardiolipin synthase-like enzyme
MRQARQRHAPRDGKGGGVVSTCLWCDEGHGPCDTHVEKKDLIRILNEAHAANKILSDRERALAARVKELEEALKCFLRECECSTEDMADNPFDKARAALAENEDK